MCIFPLNISDLTYSLLQASVHKKGGYVTSCYTKQYVLPTLATRIITGRHKTNYGGILRKSNPLLKTVNRFSPLLTQGHNVIVRKHDASTASKINIKKAHQCIVIKDYQFSVLINRKLCT